MTIREKFLARLESDAAFRAKFVGITNEQQIVTVAAANGYDLMSINSSELMSDEELDYVAGGGAIGDFFKKVVKVVYKGVMTIAKPIARVVSPIMVDILGSKMDKESKDKLKNIIKDATK